MRDPSAAPVAPSEDAVVSSRRAIEAHSKSFALASRLLPPVVREDAWVVYAWCRRVDDAIDECPAGERAEALDRLRAELNEAYGDTPSADPVLAGFQAVVRRRNIPRAYPEDLLAGMAMDVAGARYERLSDLRTYCYRVAGTVGLMMCHIMGVRRDEALVRAAHLGMAMQMTNLCRDVAEDWEQGRLYLPADWLTEEGAGWLTSVRPGDALPARARRPVARVVARVLDEADALYRSGDRGLSDLSWRCALAVRTARAVYSDIGKVLRARGCDVTGGRATVPRWRKLARALQSLARAAMECPARVYLHLTGHPRPRPPTRTLHAPPTVNFGDAFTFKFRDTP
ncbi:MAG: phytoene/squalene synthase family protein [Myxococcota bacterium]